VPGAASIARDKANRHESYQVSQRKRKRVEEIFGWMKTVGGLRRTRFIGIERTGLRAYLVGAAYNLVRMTRLGLEPPVNVAAERAAQGSRVFRFGESEAELH
jgi:hypothetical protein